MDLKINFEGMTKNNYHHVFPKSNCHLGDDPFEIIVKNFK
jgi:hypothetical protein